MLSFRDVLEIPLTDEQIKNPEGGEFFRKPGPESPEARRFGASKGLRKVVAGAIHREEPRQFGRLSAATHACEGWRRAGCSGAVR